MPATEPVSPTLADFARQIEGAETKTRLYEIADAIGLDLISRPHKRAEHEQLTELRIQVLGLAGRTAH